MQVRDMDETMRVMDVADVVAWERELSQTGVSLATLMDRAGHAVADVARALAPGLEHVVILCGSGNNGGDGWVAADVLARAGIDVALVTKVPPDQIVAQPAGAAALEAFAHGRFTVLVDPDAHSLACALDTTDLVIDAILGTGFAHDQVRSPYDAWIRQANEMRTSRGVPILAVDCPSGLNAQTGTAAAGCIRADVTVTMLAVKTGMAAREAQPYTGAIELASLVEP